MYLLKIHEDLYQWNLYTPGWNLRVRGKRAKLYSEEAFFQLLLNILYIDQYYITIKYIIAKIECFQFPGKRPTSQKQNRNHHPLSPNSRVIQKQRFQ